MNHDEAIKLIKEIRDNHNPYPADVFIEPTKEQHAEFHARLKEVGLCGTAFNGSMGRRTWIICCDDIIRALEEEGE
jgi:hypothetical protein